MRYIGLLYIATILIYWVQAEDVVCTKKMRKSVTIEEGESSSFKTQAEAKYGPRTRCQVTYKKGSSCPSLSLSCSKFDLDNKNKKCRGGDKMLVAAEGKKKRFCQNSPPNITVSGDIKLVFTTNKKKQATGAECIVECSGGNTTTVNNTSTTTLPATTNAAYCALDEGHTMCKYQ